MTSLPRLPLKSKLFYVAGMFGYSAMLRLVSGWLNKHLVPPEPAIPIVPLLVVNCAMFFGRFYIDAVTDPVVGYWSDHARTRWGRRKPFILAGGIPTALCMLGLFALHHDPFGMTGAAGQAFNNVLFVIFVTGFWVGSTLMAMPYLALLPEIAPHPTDRKQVAALLAVAVVLGVGLGQVVPGVLPAVGDLPALSLASLIMASVGFMAFYCVLVAFKEPEWAHPDWRAGDAVPGDDADAGTLDEGGDEPGSGPVSSTVAASIIEHPSGTDRPRGNGMGVRQGLRLVGSTMLYGALLYAWLLIVTPILLLVRLVARVRLAPPFRPPAPLAPLGMALKSMFRLKPFIGFASAFVALHASFVLLTLVIPYIPQTMLGGNEAANYLHELETTSEWAVSAYVVHGDVSTPGGAMLGLLRGHTSGEPIPADPFGDVLVTCGLLDADGRAALPPDATTASDVANVIRTTGAYSLLGQLPATHEATAMTQLAQAVRHRKTWLSAEAFGRQLTANGVPADVVATALASLPAEPAPAAADAPVPVWLAVKRLASGMRESSGGAEIEGADLGQRLVEAHVISDDQHQAVLRRLGAIGNSEAASILGVTLGVTLLLGVPLVYFLLGRVGHKNTGTFCLWLFILAPIALVFVGTDWLPLTGKPLVFVVCGFVGISLAGIFVLDNLLLSDVIEMDTHLTGERRESLYFGIYGLLMKMGIGLAYIVNLFLFELLGFSLTNPTGVLLSGPVSSLIVLIGALAYWRMFPHRMTREHPDRTLYIKGHSGVSGRQAAIDPSVAAVADEAGEDPEADKA